MSALAFDFTYDDQPPADRQPPPCEPTRVLAHVSDSPGPVSRRQPTAGTALQDGVAPAPMPGRRLYAVRGTVGEPAAAIAAPAVSPALRLVPTPTLDDILGQAWSSLSAGFTACPVCHEETMTARWTAGHGLAGGRCASCGSTLE